jgi:hypothetical protein
MRRGLVLEGGGAKGAWQFGVLRALADNGIRFDVVSGTSVGALNGAIWCTHQMDFGSNMWGSMHFASVFYLRVWAILLVLPGLVCRVFYAFYQGYVPRVSRSEHIGYRICAVVLALPAVSPAFSILPAIIGNGSFDRTSLLQCLAFAGWVLLTLSIFLSMGAEPNNLRSRFLNVSLYIWVVALLTRLPIIQWVFWLGCTPMVLLIASWILRKLNVSVTAPEPLERLIDKVLATPISVPLYATVAHESPSYYDPDNIRYEPVRLTAESDPIMVPASMKDVVSAYIRVDDCDRTSARETLLASSALPLGIEPARTGVGAQRLIDGGVADNVPVFPLISETDCDELVIVCCNPREPWDDEVERHAWQQIDRLKRVLDSKFVATNERDGQQDVCFDPPRAFPYSQPRRWPHQVVVIAPDYPLGSLWTGTLGFSKKRCTERMADGYKAGVRELSPSGQLRRMISPE